MLQYTGNSQRMTVTLGSNYTAGAGSLVLSTGHGAYLPSSGTFWMVPNSGTYQVFKVTARSGDTLTVTAGQDGTSDANMTAGVELEWRLTASALTQLKADVGVGTGTFANRPTAGIAGQSYQSTDYPLLSLDTGAAWVNYGPLFNMGTYDGTGLSWVNQGGATEVAAGPGVLITAPISGSVSLRIRVKSVPALPYTSTLIALPAMYPANYQRFGLLWRDSASGYVALNYFVFNNAWQIHYDRYTNATGGGGAAVKSSAVNLGTVIFLRITEDSTNRTMYFSYDGISWLQFYQETRTTYLTADQYGYFIDDDSGLYTASALITGFN